MAKKVLKLEEPKPDTVAELQDVATKTEMEFKKNYFVKKAGELTANDNPKDKQSVKRIIRRVNSAVLSLVNASKEAAVENAVFAMMIGRVLLDARNWFKGLDPEEKGNRNWSDVRSEITGGRSETWCNERIRLAEGADFYEKLTIFGYDNLRNLQRRIGIGIGNVDKAKSVLGRAKLWPANHPERTEKELHELVTGALEKAGVIKVQGETPEKPSIDQQKKLIRKRGAVLLDEIKGIEDKDAQKKLAEEIGQQLLSFAKGINSKAKRGKRLVLRGRPAKENRKTGTDN